LLQIIPALTTLCISTSDLFIFRTYIQTAARTITFTILIFVLLVCYLKKKTRIKIHRTIILPVVLYGFETWSVTLAAEHRLRLFDSRELRKI
jgi:hypothetical protein